MTTNQSPKDIERLLAEADELAQRINSDVLNEMEEEHRLQFEIHARNLENKRIKGVRKGVRSALDLFRKRGQICP